MSNCVFINQLENLPLESTLLIHYTITCSGLWDLSQYKTAYRNVCDTDWTVMYPNDQHPRHTDFPIFVQRDGGFSATFAWNYGGIRGISSSHFDSNHSFLTQICLYNINCTGVNRSGDPSGSTTGQVGTGIAPYFPVPRPHRTYPAPIGPPGPPGPPSSTPPRPSLPGGGTPNNPGVVPGAPTQGNLPGQVTVTGGRERDTTIEPSLGDRYSRNPSSPILGGGSSSEPIIRRYSDQAYIIDQNNYRNSIRVRSDLNKTLQDQNNSIGIPGILSQTTSQSSRVDPLSPLIDNPSNNYFLQNINSTSSSKNIGTISLDNELEDCVLELEVNPTEVEVGGNIIVSCFFYPNTSYIECKIELHILKQDQTSLKVTETEFKSSSKEDPLVISSPIGLSNYNEKVYIVSKVISTSGDILKVSSKAIHILPIEGNKEKSSTDSLPIILKNYAGFTKDPYNFTIYNSQPVLFLIENSSEKSGDIVVVGKSSSKLGIRIETLDTEALPIVVNSTLDYEQRFSLNNNEVKIAENNGWASVSNIETAIVSIYPLENLEEKCPIEVYLPDTFTLKTQRATINQTTSLTANITVRTYYPYKNIKLMVNGYQKGKISSSNYTATGTANIVGDKSFSNVPIKRDEWISVFIEENSNYNLTNPIIETKS